MPPAKIALRLYSRWCAVTVAAGDSKVCTITNTRKPRLTVNKVLVPANDPTKLYGTALDGGGGDEQQPYGDVGMDRIGNVDHHQSVRAIGYVCEIIF